MKRLPARDVVTCKIVTGKVRPEQSVNAAKKRYVLNAENVKC